MSDPTSDSSKPTKVPATGMVRAGGMPDDSVLRALAHPARSTILRHLISHGPATATDCAPLTGLSPSACSFHLRELAKVGLVERNLVEHPNERRHLWRATPRNLSFLELAHTTTPEEGASLSVWELLQTQRQQDVHRYLSREHNYPEEWQAAAGRDEVVVVVTAEELSHLRWTIRQLLRSLTASRPDLREGTDAVMVAIDYTPMFDPPREASHDKSDI